MSFSKKAFLNARIRVEGVAYGTADIDIEDTIDETDVTDTEGSIIGFDNPEVGLETFVIYEETLPTKKRARVTVTNATWDANLNPFDAPFSLEAGRLITFSYVPDEIENTNMAWRSFALLLTSVGQRGQIDGGQPVRFSGRTLGWFDAPSPDASAKTVVQLSGSASWGYGAF